MPTPAKAKASKFVRFPQATAHILERKIELTPEQTDKLQAALDGKLPLKMKLDVKTKLWAIDDVPPEMKMAVASGGDDDEEIIDETFEPDDDGVDIPEDEEEDPDEEQSGGDSGDGGDGEMSLAARSTAKGGKRKKVLVGATITLYAVAVFRPKYQRAPSP